MSIVILVAKNGAFLLSTQVETPSDELPTPPGIEAFQMPDTTYRSHREVFSVLGDLLKVLPGALKDQPDAWKWQKAMSIAPQDPIASDKVVSICKVDGGFAVESSGISKPVESDVPIMRIVERPNGSGKICEVYSKGISPVLIPAGGGSAFGRSELYAFGRADEVVSFLGEHLAATLK